jgi:glycosyltransferase involved in cell wall biosynthesis
MSSSPGISAFFPAYNDGGTIASMVVNTVLTLQSVTDDYEVIVVDDGSSDYTPEILDELARRYPGVVRVIHHETNKGYGGALRTGFSSSTKDLIFYTDGDAQYDPREIKTLLPLMTPEVDLVNGWKIGRSDPLHRIIAGKIYQYVIRFMFRLKLKDVDCDFRLMRRSIFDKVHLEHNSGIICVELMKKVQMAGFRLAEAPVHHFHRAYGRSQFFNFRRLARVGIDLIGLWWELVGQRRLGLLRRIVPSKNVS